MANRATTLQRRHLTMRAVVKRDVIDPTNTSVTIKYADGTVRQVSAPGDDYGQPVYRETDLHDALPCHIVATAGMSSDVSATIERLASIGDYVMLCAIGADLKEQDRITSVVVKGETNELLDGVELHVNGVKERFSKPLTQLGARPEFLEVSLERYGRP